jgi:arylsulfatase A-like enzyme
VRALLALVLLALLAGSAFLLFVRRAEVGTFGEEVHLFGLADRVSFDGEGGFRVYSHGLGADERILLPLIPDSTLEVRGLEVLPGAALSFAVGSLEEGWAGREAFELAVRADGASLLERTFRRADLAGGWSEFQFPLPPGTKTLRFGARAQASSRTYREAVLLADPVLRSPGRRARLPREARGLVVVLVDTLRADRLSFTGYRRATTPTLDRFAEAAVRFRNALSPTSWTKPAVASLFTGLSPARHGATHAFSALPPSTPVLAEALRGAGWRTGAFVNNRLISLPEFRFDRGFDAFLPVDARAKGIFDLALAWIEANAAAPFFCYLHLFDPHEPYDPPAPFGQRFVAEVAPQGIPAAVPADLERKIRVALYDGEIAYLDACFGRFLERLRRLGLGGRSKIVFLSDHGEEFWEHGGEGHAHTVYEELVRIPLLLGGGSGGELEPLDVLEPVTIEDLFPTVARIGGASVPEGLDGIDLGRAIRRARRREAPGPSRAFFHETEHPRRRAFALRRENWKYLESVEREGGPPEAELYDLASDPGEKRNLLSVEPERAGALARLLSAYRGATGRGTWHISFRAKKKGMLFSGRVEAPGGTGEARIESGGEESAPEFRREGESFLFRIRAEGTTAGLSFRSLDPRARIRVLVEADGQPLPAAGLRVGPGDRRAPSVPFEIGPAEADSADFLLDPVPALGPEEATACRVWRFEPPQVRAEDLAPEDVERLRALGYLLGR